MFSILDGRTEFYQWDIDRKLVVADASITEVHFCNKTDNCSLVCAVYEMNGQRLVNVPNILLQNSWRINVYGYDINYTKHSKQFNVVARTKPADYLYQETETLSFSEVLTRAETAADTAEQYNDACLNLAHSATLEVERAKANAELATRERARAEASAKGAAASEENAKDSEANAKNYALRAERAGQEAQGNAELITDCVGEIASAIKGKVSGETVTLEDVSIFPHTLGISVESKNLNKYPYYSQTKRGNPYIANGITFVANEDGTLTFSGDCSAWVSYEFSQQTALPIYLKKGVAYTLSSGGTVDRKDIYLSLKLINSNLTYTTINGELTFIAPQDDIGYLRLVVNKGCSVDSITVYPLLEKNKEATAYTPYVEDLTAVKVNVDGVEYPVEADLTVNGIEANYPTTTLTTDTTGVAVNVEYNRDTNKVINNLVEAIISLGGNI